MSWVLWFDTPSNHKSKDDRHDIEKWMNNIDKIYTLDDIKKIVPLFNKLLQVEEMWYLSEFLLFQEGILPHIDDEKLYGCNILEFHIAGVSQDTWINLIIHSWVSPQVKGITIMRDKVSYRINIFNSKKIKTFKYFAKFFQEFKCELIDVYCVKIIDPRFPKM
jgi:hypothetical protein